MGASRRSTSGAGWESLGMDVDDDASVHLSGEEVRGGRDGIAERDFAGDRIELRRIEIAREA